MILGLLHILKPLHSLTARSGMQEEMQSLEKNGTWDVVCLPKHKKVVCYK
jgi:hypothetical protein